MNKERGFKVDLSRLEQLKIDEVVKKLVVNDIKNKTKEEKYYFATRNNDIIMNHITIENNFVIIDYGVIFKIINIYDEQNVKLKYYLYDIVAIRITKLERNSIYENYSTTDLFNDTPAYYRSRYGEDY
jgi:carbamoylphosphate synthase small subunit